MSKAKYISKLVDASGSTTSANVSYTGTLTGSTGILNIGSGQLYKDASGNVGIGTSSPDSVLSVYAANKTIPAISARYSAAGFKAGFSVYNVNGYPYLSFNVNPVTSSNSGTYDITGVASKIDFASSASSADIIFSNAISGTAGTAISWLERMRIDSSGNVGIGTSSPAKKLDVLGEAQISFNSINTYLYYQSTNNYTGRNTDGNMWMNVAGGYSNIFGVAGSEKMRIDSSGNVGIGTSSPTNISGNGDLTVLNRVFAGVANASYPSYSFIGRTDSGMWSPSASTIAFSTGFTERMRIDSSGKVGINVTPSASTSAKLQVTGGTTNATTLATSYSTAVVAYVPKSSSGYSLAIASGTSDLPQLQVSANGTASGDLLIQPYGGNVGIGTSSPYSQLDVYSGIASPTAGEASGVGSIRITNGASVLTSAGGLEFKIAGDSNGYGSKIQALNSGGSQLVFANRNASATWIERMRIDASGRITKPSQPAFKAYASTSGSNYTTGGTKITAYDTTTFNIGGHYSTVNKRFTAPIAGVYMFAARAWATGGNTTGAGINITVNGASVIATIRIATSPGDYTTMNPFTEVYLNANDYVEVFTETCTSTGQVHISQGEAYSGFTGYFLG